MLGFLFGFNARLGRLHFFLATIALAVVMTAICYAIASTLMQSSYSGAVSTAVQMTWPVIGAVLFFGWVTFTLQSMRIRDIGWDPVCVIPAWIAILIVDKLVASRIPSWSLGHDQHGTIVGAAINLVILLALMFWPSGDSGYDDSPTYRSTQKPTKPLSRKDAASPAAERLARVSGAEFGNRRY
jgi:uncharacterized membrane protein YhaH (DUF805 family)